MATATATTMIAIAATMKMVTGMRMLVYVSWSNALLFVHVELIWKQARNAVGPAGLLAVAGVAAFLI